MVPTNRNQISKQLITKQHIYTIGFIIRILGGIIMSYCERTLRRKALNIGYEIHKGYVHYMYNRAVFKHESDNNQTGYSVTDLRTGIDVYGCYNNYFDNIWNLQDVENFLKEQYNRLELKW